jgi:hypothetical protein
MLVCDGEQMRGQCHQVCYAVGLQLDFRLRFLALGGEQLVGCLVHVCCERLVVAVCLLAVGWWR